MQLWGARGSVPVYGARFRRYGGNTPCVEMRCGDRTLIFDAGTWHPSRRPFYAAVGVSDMHLFFTHFHYDHVLGLPFFSPL